MKNYNIQTKNKCIYYIVTIIKLSHLITNERVKCLVPT